MSARLGAASAAGSTAMPTREASGASAIARLPMAMRPCARSCETGCAAQRAASVLSTPGSTGSWRAGTQAPPHAQAFQPWGARWYPGAMSQQAGYGACTRMRTSLGITIGQSRSAGAAAPAARW